MLSHTSASRSARAVPTAHYPGARWPAALAPALVALAAAVSPYHSATAQGRVAGSVRDTTGAGVAGAEISVAGTALTAQSDETGAFALAGLPPGPAQVRVRRLGFAPAAESVLVRTGATTPFTITIVEVARQLTPVVIRAERYRRYTGYLADFYERRDRGFGRFITGDEIERRDPMRLTDMLRTVPGMNVATPALGASHVRIRGNTCAPVVWLDGTPALAAEFDLDALAPKSVAAIEIYSGPAAVPPQFVVPFGPTACGTIVIWSRQGEPRQRRRRAVTAAQLDTLVTKQQAFTAERVDTPARADAAAPIAPVYPDSLYRAQVPGRVVVEFVVDTAGRAAIETLGVVSSTDPLFTGAVRRAIPEARFTPARIAGRPVPQVVRQAFAFVIPADLMRPAGTRPRP